MEVKLIALAGLLALSSMVSVQAGVVAAEMQDAITDKANADLIAPIAQQFLDKYYPTLHVQHVGVLQSFVVKDVTYQWAAIVATNPATGNWGHIMYYLYAGDMHGHFFLPAHLTLLSEFKRTGDKLLLFNNAAPEHVMDDFKNVPD